MSPLTNPPPPPDAGGALDPAANLILHFTGDFQPGTDYTPDSNGYKVALGDDGAMYLAVGATDLVTPPEVAGTIGNWFPLGGAGGGSTVYLASVPGVQTETTAWPGFATGRKAAEIPFTTAGPAIVEYALNLEDWHDGNGVQVAPAVDDVALRSLSNFNAVSLAEWVFGADASTWIFHVLSPKGAWEGNGAIAADKARELLFGRQILVGAGAHTADVRFGINSTGEARVRNVQLAVRVTEVVAV